MAVTPQLTLPNVIVNGDDFDATPVEENFVALQGRINAHTHTEYAVKGAITVGDLAFDIATQAELDTAIAGEVTARTAADLLLLPKTGGAISGNLSVGGTFVVTGQLTGNVISAVGLYSNRAATSNPALSLGVAGEAQYRLISRADGLLQWSDGIAVADTNLYRSGVGLLRTDGSLTVSGANGGNAPAGGWRAQQAATTGATLLAGSVTGDTQNRITVQVDGKITWGAGNAAGDVSLFRHSALRLGTDAVIRSTRSLTTSTTFESMTTPDAAVRHTIFADGKMTWGDGTSASDTTLSRTSTGVLTAGEAFQVGSTITIGAVGSNQGVISLKNAGYVSARFATNVGSASFVTRLATDTVDRLLIQADGKHLWSDGTLAADTNLYRAGAALLQSDGEIRAKTTATAFGSIRPTDTREPFNISVIGGMAWGDGTVVTDVSLSRIGVGQLQLNNRLSITNGSVATAFSTIISGDASSRFAIDHSGGMIWGPGASAQDLSISRQSAGILQLGAASQNFRLLHYGGSSTAIAHSIRGTTSDVNDRFQIRSDGQFSWGDGTATTDTNLFRSSVGLLATTSQFSAGRVFVDVVGTSANSAFNAKLSTDTGQRFQVLADGKLQWGDGTAAADTTLRRAGVAQLRTDGFFDANRTLATADALGTAIAGEALNRLRIRADGQMLWGDGTLVADTNLYRRNAGELAHDGLFASITSSSVNNAFAAHVSGDTQRRIVIRGDGVISWGSGALASDAALYRSAVGTLRTDTAFSIGTSLSVASGISQTNGSGNSYFTSNGTLTDTAAGAITALNFTATINPGAASATDFRSLNMSATIPLASTFDYSTSVKGGNFETRWLGSGNVTGVLIGSQHGVVIPATAQSFGTITQVTGIAITGLSEFASSAIVGTVTSATGLVVNNNGRTNITLQNSIGVDLLAQTSGTASNIGLRIAKASTYTLQLSDAGGTAAGGITFSTDTNLYRSAAGRLKSDHLITAPTLGLATKQKAGTPTDADWAVAPPDGTIVVDSTGSKIWARVGGVWKSATLA